VEVINTANYNRLQIDDLWKLLKYNYDLKFPMGCTISTDDKKLIERIEKEEGLFVNHAYGLTRCIEHNGRKLLRLQNPWGKTVFYLLFVYYNFFVINFIQRSGMVLGRTTLGKISQNYLFNLCVILIHN